jgi:hypothetical protein
MFIPQDVHRIVNPKATNNLFDSREVNYVLIKLVEVVELCFDHLSVPLLLSYPHFDVHAHQEMNLIQHHRMDLHICLLCFGLHPFCFRR